MHGIRKFCFGLTVIAGSALAGCATTPAEDDPVMVKLNDVDARTARIERVVANNSLLELSQRMDSLQSQIQVLRGRIDQLENTNETLRKQQRDLYADLDKRLTQLEGGASGAQSGAQPRSSVAEQAAYAQAINDLKVGQYPTAISELNQFLTQYPQSELADNAQYWLGEAYYVSREFADAATAFHAVTERWPKSRKAPDALLKLGYCQDELKRPTEARATLNEVLERFPGTDDARLARLRLQRMGGGANAPGAAPAESGSGADSSARTPSAASTAPGVPQSAATAAPGAAPAGSGTTASGDAPAKPSDPSGTAPP